MIYGGSIMTMVYDNRSATKEIDCVFSEINFKLLENILNLTRSAFNLPAGWINKETKEPLKSFYTNPSSLKTRNVYFDLDGINRV